MGRKVGDVDTAGRSKRKRMVEKAEIEAVASRLTSTLAVLNTVLHEMASIQSMEVDGAGLAKRGLDDVAAYASNVQKALTSPWSVKISAHTEPTKALKKK